MSIIFFNWIYFWFSSKIEFNECEIFFNRLDSLDLVFSWAFLSQRLSIIGYFFHSVQAKLQCLSSAWLRIHHQGRLFNKLLIKLPLLFSWIHALYIIISLFKRFSPKVKESCLIEDSKKRKLDRLITKLNSLYKRRIILRQKV